MKYSEYKICRNKSFIYLDKYDKDFIRWYRKSNEFNLILLGIAVDNLKIEILKEIKKDLFLKFTNKVLRLVK